MTPDTSSDSGNFYTNPELATWLGSFEGVPDLPASTVTAVDSVGQTAWQQSLNRLFEWAGQMMPGVGLAAALAIAGKTLSIWIGVNGLGFKNSPISPIILAILLGLVIRNVIGLPAVYQSGLQWCVKKILRIGIALLGIRLSLLAAGRIGLVALPIVLGCIAVALLLVSRINQALGLPRRLGSLIAVGTSICGVSAIVAVAPLIDAEDDEVSYAVACITLFGIVALFLYPMLSHWIFAGDSTLAGLFLGTAIHDTSQVAGAGLMYQQQYDAPQALNTAVVTKLVRNLFMIGVIPMMAILYHRKNQGASRTQTPTWYRMVPFFVLGFVGMTLLCTIGDLGDRPFMLLDSEAWSGVIGSTKNVATWCLMIAMAAVGLGTSVQRIVKLGWKPFSVGLAAAILVGAVIIILVKTLGPLLL